MKIPEGYIENARKYSVLSIKSNRPIPLGGKIMMNLVVREQMDMNNIVATMGVENNSCMILVDYSENQIYEMIGEAKQRIEKMKSIIVN